MRDETEQAKWVVVLQAREHPPGPLPVEDDDRVRWSEVDVRLAISGFSVDISGGEEQARLQAVDALGWLRDRRGISPLIRALGDSSSAVCRAATAALSSFASLPRWAAPALLHALSFGDVATRSHAAVALGRCHDTLTLDRLIEALDDPASPVRASAARGIKEFGRLGANGSEAVPRLGRLLDDPDARVACNAFWALRAQAGPAEHAGWSTWRWSPAGHRALREIAGR